MSQGNNPAPVVSVVVPARNEAGNIGPLVEEIATVLQGRAFEVVCVNDGSEDTTEEELRSLMTQFPWLRQIVHAESCGQSAAIRTGVRLARAATIVTIDGDGQNDPAFIPRLIVALENSPSVGSHRRPACQPRDIGFQKTSIAHRQWRSQRRTQRRCQRHRLRAQGIPPRSVFGITVF